MDDDGRTAIAERADNLGLKNIRVVGLKPLKAVETKLSEELKTFLETVGIGLMTSKFLARGDNWEAAVVAAKEHSLGYKNRMGGLVTPLNVPSSTYTALWRPGTYDPSGVYANRASCSAPWIPLFIRASQLARVVLY